MPSFPRVLLLKAMRQHLAAAFLRPKDSASLMTGTRTGQIWSKICGAKRWIMLGCFPVSYKYPPMDVESSLM